MFAILFLIAIIVILILIVGLHEKSTNAICISRKRLDGKTVLVTGGTAGIGLEIATDLAHRGARVIIACPFNEEGENARKQIIQATENENIIFKHLDLASLKSVRKFAEGIIADENRLDILINNAGVGVPKDCITADGMHFVMQINYYGTFLLTLLLLPLLIKTGIPGERSRILLTSSVLHQLGQIDLENMNRPNHYRFRLQYYNNSKLCLVVFGHELAKRLNDCNVVVNCIDPGAVATRIFDSGNKAVGSVLKLFIRMLFKTPWEGAQTALHVALDKKTGDVSGKFFKNCHISRAVQRAYCDKTAKTLWVDSMRLTQMSNEELERQFSL